MITTKTSSMTTGKKLLAAALFALSMGALTACDLNMKAVDGTPTPNAQTSTANLATTADIDSLKKAVANIKSAKSFHLETNVNLTDVIVRDVDQANHRSLYTHCDETSGTCTSVTTIMTDTYATTDGGKTYKQGTKGDVGLDALNYVWDNMTPDKIDKASKVLQIGSASPVDTFDGAASKHFIITAADMTSIAPALDVAGTNGTFDIWISQSDQPVVLQLSFTGKAGFWPFTDKDLIAAARWSKIDATLDIQPPPADKIVP